MLTYLLLSSYIIYIYVLLYASVYEIIIYALSSYNIYIYIYNVCDIYMIIIIMNDAFMAEWSKALRSGRSILYIYISPAGFEPAT